MLSAHEASWRKAAVADAVEAVGQHVDEEAADELTTASVMISRFQRLADSPLARSGPREK